MVITKEIIESGIYGLAIGDALGVPYEFCTREKMKQNPCNGMIGYGTYGKPVGTWSDDTSLTLATMDGLSEKSPDVLLNLMNKFHLWLLDDLYTVDGTFDVGRTTLQAICRFERGVSPDLCGGAGERDNGNGSLMRILPAVLFSLSEYGCVNYDFIDDIGALTHAHAISKTACRIYAETVRAILEINAGESVDITFPECGVEQFSRLYSDGFINLPADEIKSSGYVVDTLEAALWCFLNSKSFGECVLKAVNLGGDTDTVAAISGSLAGLYYGKESIPDEWLKLLRGREIIDSQIDKFFNFLQKRY